MFLSREILKVATEYFAPTFLIFLLFLSLSCSDQTDEFGKYYEGQYNEDILFYSPLDSFLLVSLSTENFASAGKTGPFRTDSPAEAPSVKILP